MALTPEEIKERMLQAAQAFEEKAYNQAVSILGSIIKEDPGYAPAYRELGEILMHSPSQEKALAYLKRAIELSAQDAENWKALANFHKRHKAWAEALKAYSQALQYSPQDTKIMLEMLQVYQTMGDKQSALRMAASIKDAEPDNMEYLWGYAKLLKEAGKNEEALAQYDLLVRSGREDIPVVAVEEWVAMAKKYGCRNNLREEIRSLLQSNPNHVMLKYLYAHSCITRMETEEALHLLEDIEKLAAEDIMMNERLSTAYNMMGLSEKAEVCIDHILEKNPLHAQALLAKSNIRKCSYGDGAFRRLNFATAHLCEFSPKEKAHLHYALGKAYDDTDDLAAAFEHYKVGGMLNSQGKYEGDLTVMQRILASISKPGTKTYFEQETNKGFPSDVPVFVVGTIRSGTSLIEQVLSELKGVYGAGELEYSLDVLNRMEANGMQLNFGDAGFCFQWNEKSSYKERGEKYLALVKELAPAETKRIIDKAPANFTWLGYLHLILPNARFIHSRRHPVETCLSAYRIHFAQGQHWSDDLRTMGKYYRLYTEMMQHWKEVLPEGTILDVRYEDMVADLEGQSKRMAEYIGVAWDPACMAFHASKRAVRTASLAQVRQPIYTTSVNRWHKYEPYLQPLLDEIGDIVEAYEAELADN